MGFRKDRGPETWRQEEVVIREKTAVRSPPDPHKL